MGKKDKEKEQTVPLGLWVWISTCRREPLHFFLGHIFFWISRLPSAYSIIQARASMREDPGVFGQERGDGVGGRDHFYSTVAGCCC